MTTQDAFEAWARYLDISTEQDGWQGLRYTHSHVQAMWEGWQAATLAAKRQPLSVAQIAVLISNVCDTDDLSLAEFAREVEAAHGIKA